MTYQLFIQSLAIIAVIFFIISFQAKSRKNILILQIISITIWTIHFYLLSALTGAVLLVINGIITVLFLFKGKSRKLESPLILYLSLLIFLIATIITWQNFYSLFPLLAVSSIIIAKWQNKTNMIRMLSFPASILWIIYDSFVGAYGSIIAELLIIISILVSLSLNKKNK